MDGVEEKEDELGEKRTEPAEWASFTLTVYFIPCTIATAFTVARLHIYPHLPRQSCLLTRRNRAHTNTHDFDVPADER